MLYRVQRLAGPTTVDAQWDKPAWQEIAPLELTHFMGQRPDHFPRTRARLAYDDQAIQVIFRVEDRFVRAVAPHHDGQVWKDSCVEFFFAPWADLSAGYFNLEMNCGGTMLLHFQVIPRQSKLAVSNEQLERLQVATSLPRIVHPEIAEPTTWVAEYRLPIDLLLKTHPEVRPPASGVRWRANFYKCGDETSHPHWLTWAPVDRPEPDFHRPESFGTIEFV